MIDIAELLDQYRKDITVRNNGDAVFIALPFYHIDSDESIALQTRNFRLRNNHGLS